MRMIAAGIIALFSISVSAEEGRDQAALARQILSCVTYLSPKVKDKDSRYHVHSPKAQFYFNLDTSPRGVYSLSEAGAAFCPANFPRNGHIQFRIHQQEVRYSTSREGPESRLGRLQCQPISSEALAVMNRQAEDLIRNYVRTKSQVFVDDIQNELGPYCGQRRDFIKQAVADTRPPAKLPLPPPTPSVEPVRSPTQFGN
ncbi:MAG: hypothetical protein K2Q26_15115 [Bdellovibrionales bacterium]|nr:hypothetical protein [Bdellovibrionales bacterium]